MTDVRPDDTTARTADAVEMIRREEHLRLAVETYPTERVRIEKYIVTEQRTITVDVRREEVRLTREPITAADGPVAPSSDPSPIVIVLREEQVTITKTIVPVERVTVEVAVARGEQQVSDTLRREQIDVEPDLPL